MVPYIKQFNYESAHKKGQTQRQMGPILLPGLWEDKMDLH